MADNWVKTASQIPWSRLDTATKDRWIHDIRLRVPNMITKDETLSPAQVAAATSAAQAFTVTGVKANDVLLDVKTAAGTLFSDDFIILPNKYVSADDEITLVFRNTHGSTAKTPTSQLYTFVLLRTPA